MIDPGCTSSVREQIQAFAAAATVIVAPRTVPRWPICSSRAPAPRSWNCFPRGVLLPDFWRLATGVPGLTYRYVSAPAVTRQSRAQAIVRDIEVDIDGPGRHPDDEF